MQTRDTLLAHVVKPPWCLAGEYPPSEGDCEVSAPGVDAPAYLLTLERTEPGIHGELAEVLGQCLLDLVQG